MVTPWLKRQLRDWCPPIVARWLRPVPLSQRPQQHVWFRGEYLNWNDAVVASSGYDSAVILDKVLAATLKVKSGDAVYERDSVIFDQVQYTWPVLAALMWVASQNNSSLRVLDFGGALGSSYFENLAFTRNLAELKWGVVEQPSFVAAGCRDIADKQLCFFDNIQSCVESFDPNCVLMSNVLQYVADYNVILQELLELKTQLIVVDRTIVNKSSSDRVYVQDVPPEIYSASYPVRSLSESRLLRKFEENGYQRAAEFKSLHFPGLVSIDSEFKGYLWWRANKV